MSKKRLILTGLNFVEKISNDTNKILCVECGGKGFYLLIQNGNTKGELVNCEYCEKGFKYIKRELKDYGEKAKSSKCSC